MPRIEICGNIASGKTTMCRNLANSRHVIVYEDFQSNPFYEDFYKDPQAYSFETELTFLLQHYHSIKKHPSGSHLVCDYSLIQDMAYADVNLTGSRHKIFFEVLNEVQKEIGYPGKLIYLTCLEEILLERIRGRNREVESSISVEYLQALAKAIKLRVESVPSDVQIAIINSGIVDFKDSGESIQSLVKL